MPQVQVRDNIPNFEGSEIIIRVGHDEIMGGRLNLNEAMLEGAKEIAKTYIEDHMAEVLSKMDPTAVANLAIAESAKLIRKQFIDLPKKEKES